MRSFAACFFTCMSVAFADLPVHCVRHEVTGIWRFTLGPADKTRSTCGHERPDTRWSQPNRSYLEATEQMVVSLRGPNRATTVDDSEGHWTMIYDEGFEVNVRGLSFVAFSNFTFDAHKRNQSHCGETMVGWYRNIDRTKFGCWYGSRISENAARKVTETKSQRSIRSAASDQPLDAKQQTKKVKEINKKLQLMQVGWKAREISKWNGRTPRELNGLAGLKRSVRSKDLHRDMLRQRLHRPHSFLQRVGAPSFAQNFDWSNVSNINFLEPVMDQGDCGSCYAASSVRMLTSRHKIAIQNASAVPWSISFPLYCSEFNQGCDGGYGFLLSRWSQDVGLLPANCMRYKTAGTCSLDCDLKELQGKRYRVANHRYVGSFYGHSNEQLMMDELFKNGPMAIGIEPAEDFMYYSEGIYQTADLPKHRVEKEWEQVDHGVLLVGWGEDNGVKYWRVQNSWGPDWGEDGFFRILRGRDDSAIESMAEAADVVEDEQAGAHVEELFKQIHAAGGPPKRKPLTSVPFP